MPGRVAGYTGPQLSNTPRRLAEPHVAVCVDKSRSYGRGVLRGIADYLEQVGPWSMFVDQYAVAQLDEAWLKRWRGDGILAYISNEAAARRLARSKIPVVDVAGSVRFQGLARVVADDRRIGELVGEHFLERQFRRFAYVGPSGTVGESWPDESRFAGFIRTVGGDCCDRYVYPRNPGSLSGWEQEQQKLAKWLTRLERPLGVMAYSDVQAREVLDACSRVGLSVPEEVAVVGVDNDEELCRLSRIPLSSVASNPQKIGFEAARMISRLMSGDGPPFEASEVIVQPRYVVTRRSSDVTAVDDLVVARALSYIHQHASEPISIDDVARAVGLPRRSLYRRFADSLDRTPHQELQRARFQRVRRLLAETELPIAEVAHLSGFESGAYLCTCFKRIQGSTPGEFRERHQNRGRG